MASTSWVELYFRSLNPNNVFDQLTNYLLQYRTVSIPSVGTIRLVHQPSQLDVADKIITPPGFTAEISSEETVSEHQLAFLAAALQEEKDGVMRRLTELGKRLHSKMQDKGFEWKGIGIIRPSGEPVVVTPTLLEPVRAERVLRPDARHSVLVGDQERSSEQMAVTKEDVSGVAQKERSLWMMLGWILLGLAILYIVFLLYQGKFRVGATGSRQSPTGYLYTPIKQLV